MADPLHQLTLDGLLEEHCRSFPDKAAAVYKGLNLTYPQLRARVHRLADALQRTGVGKGDRILWLGQNAPHIQEGVIAASTLGAMFCPVNWRQSPPELAFILDDLAPKVVVWQADGEVGPAVKAARELASYGGGLWLRQDGEGADTYEHFLSAASPDAVERPINPTLPALVIYTAAFDGRPNGAMLSQHAILAQSPSVARVQDFTHETVFLASGPLFHIGTHMFVWATFALGGTNVYMPRVDALALCETIHGERVTNAFIVGKTMTEMAALNRDRRYDLTCLRSDPFHPEWDAMVTLRDKGQGTGYGQTELTGLVTWPYYGAGIGVHGRPAPIVQIRIVDNEDRDVAPGETGEIVCRGPTVMNGYWNRPALNAARQRGGWHHTNDLGRREADGTLTFIGPKTQMIKSGVENIYPAEVEGCLKTHPAVADCAVIGVPDDVWVQSVKAIVVLKPGADATPEELIEHCKARIASYKKSKHVVFAETLPRIAGGALDYAALDKAHGGGNYPGGTVRSR